MTSSHDLLPTPANETNGHPNTSLTSMKNIFHKKTKTIRLNIFFFFFVFSWPRIIFPRKAHIIQLENGLYTILEVSYLSLSLPLSQLSWQPSRRLQSFSSFSFDASSARTRNLYFAFFFFS